MLGFLPHFLGYSGRWRRSHLPFQVLDWKAINVDCGLIIKLALFFGQVAGLASHSGSGTAFSGSLLPIAPTLWTFRSCCVCPEDDSGAPLLHSSTSFLATMRSHLLLPSLKATDWPRFAALPLLEECGLFREDEASSPFWLAAAAASEAAGLPAPLQPCALGCWLPRVLPHDLIMAAQLDSHSSAGTQGHPWCP